MCVKTSSSLRGRMLDKLELQVYFSLFKIMFIYKDYDIMFCDNTMRIRSCLSPIYSDAYCDA